MTEPSSQPDPQPEPKGPNFLLVVALAGLALIIIFIVVYFFVGDHGQRLLPHAHPRDAEPTSRLILPAWKSAAGSDC
jgi:hypothetical protein